MKKQIISGLIGLLMLSGWINHGKSPIKEAEWLAGTWESKTARGSMYETWSKTSTVALTGKSYMLNAKDTIVFETIVLQEEQNGLVYIPTVKDQNKGQSVRFVSTQISRDKLVFENRQHDFPQLISYTRIGEDSLLAEISGTKNGKQRKQIFPMKKIN